MGPKRSWPHSQALATYPLSSADQFTVCSSLTSVFPASHYCPFFGQNVFSILMSGTFGLYYSFDTRDQASHPYRTTGKITFLCNLIFMFKIVNGRAKGYGQNRGRHCPKLICMQFVSVFLTSEPCHISKVFVRCLYMTVGSCVLFTNNQHLGLLPFLSIYARSLFLLATNIFVFSCIVFVCLPNKVTAADVYISFSISDCFKRLVEWFISDEHCQIEKLIVA
jgi:hypothetical protein